MVSKFWLPEQKVYIVVADCNTKEDARAFAMNNEHSAPVFFTGDEPSANVKGTLLFPDGTEETTVLPLAGRASYEGREQ